MMLWKRWLLSNMAIFGIYVKFRGVSANLKQPFIHIYMDGHQVPGKVSVDWTRVEPAACCSICGDLMENWPATTRLASLPFQQDPFF